MFIDQIGGTLSYEGWQEDNRALTEQIRQERVNIFLRRPGQVIEITGDVVEITSVIAAPFTQGATIPLARIGAGVSLLGVSIQVAADAHEGKWDDVRDKLLIETISMGVTKSLGKLAKKGIGKDTSEEWMRDFVDKKIGSTATIIENVIEQNSQRNESSK